MMSRYISMPVYKLLEEFYSDPTKVFEYLEAIYDRIDRVENRVKAYITIIPREESLRHAEELVKRFRDSRVLPPLFGIAIAVKDNISTKGIRTTCASKMLENYIPPYDATVIERIKVAGGIIIGKTNMDEFAMGSTTETSAFHPTRNPWDLERSPGGSSGGSAAALVSGETSLALGSDTGGSIRNPAAFTATYGLKPTYGLVSRYGLIAYGSSLDQIGPMARNTRDLAILLNIISGYDERDSTSILIQKQNYVELMDRLIYDEPKLHIGIIKELFEGSEDSVKFIAYKAVDKLCSYHICEELSIPYTRQIVAAYYIIAMAEASSNLARYDGIRYGLRKSVENRDWIDVYSDVRTEGFGYEVKKRIALGAYVLSIGYREMYYIRALRFRRMLRDKFNEIFKKFDAVVSPTMPILPPRLGEFIEDPIKMYLSDINTVIANLIGAPAISIPIGFSNRLPVGLQIMSKPLNEPIILYLSNQLENAIGYKDLVTEV